MLFRSPFIQFSLYAFNTTVSLTFYVSIFNMEHFKTNRGKPGILNEEKKGFKNDTFVKMPEKQTCKARCRTDLENTMILGGRFDHDHVEEEEEGTEKDMQTEGSSRTLTNQTNHHVSEQG